MKIVVDFNYLPEKDFPASCRLYKEVFVDVARRQTGHVFTFIVNNPDCFTDDLPRNVTLYVPKQGIWRYLGFRWWYYYIFPGKLLKWKTDLVVSINNLYANSRTIPCCLFIITVSLFTRQKRKGRKLGSISRVPGRCLQHTTRVITNSEYDKNLVNLTFPATGHKLISWPLHITDEMEMMAWAEKESVKTTYSGGLEYFLFAGDIHERHCLVDLLLAFSQFKKWQQSNMRLLIAGSTTAYTNEFADKLKTYKYRGDVHLLAGVSAYTLNDLIGGAYAVVYPAVYDHFPATILKAMKACVPVITSGVGVIQELSANAVIFAKPDNADGFARSLQMIFKDENLRDSIIELGKNHLQNKKTSHLADDCWQLLLGSINLT